jgi:transposase
MATSRTRQRFAARRPDVVQKPRGTFHPRVQKVGPEHFGIVCIDCAKARSKWMLTDFFGNVLLPPPVLAHNRTGLAAALDQLRQAAAAHQLRDLLVAVERTGRYHRVVQNAFRHAGYETRLVHPFATKQFRQPSDPEYKTDDTDLVALFRATTTGFALIEPERDETWRTLQLLVRGRRDLVNKRSLVCCQLRERLDAAFPGLAACFAKFWDTPCLGHLLRQFASPQAFLQAGPRDLNHSLRQARIRFQQRTLDKLLAWAEQAAPPDLAAAMHRRMALALDDDRTLKTRQIQELERDIAAALAPSPYILLLSFPGLNVVSAGEFAGEMGPIEHYANSRAITGRAGLRPSRYQSDLVDKAGGPLITRCNRNLRAAILGVADNLIRCDHHFQELATRWASQGKDPRHSHVKVALRFCRIACQMVAGRQVFRHPGIQGRHYILDKLIAFHRAHETAAEAVLADVQAALAHLPAGEQQAEAVPLQKELQRIPEGGRRGPQIPGDILPIVLARLGVKPVESRTSGEQDLR